jgi:hypothetical protein
MKKIAAQIANLLSRVTKFELVHAKGSSIKGNYSAGRRDFYNSDYNGQFPNKL